MAGASRPVTARPPSSCLVTVAPRAVSSPASSPARGERTRTSWRALDSISRAVEVSARSRPRPMTIRWSAVWAISLIRWLDTMTVRPSAARALNNCRIQAMPSVSRPLTGSSNISTGGSPSSATARPRRCFMPSEKPPTRRPATASRPVSCRTSVTRWRPMPLLRAIEVMWARAVRPPCRAVASSSAPTSRSGRTRVSYLRWLMRAVPLVGASRPRMTRIVVLLPAPLGPRKPVTWPGRTVKLRPSTAVTAPKRLTSRSTSITARFP